VHAIKLRIPAISDTGSWIEVINVLKTTDGIPEIYVYLKTPVHRCKYVPYTP